jgi:hypothetical protein
MRVWLVYDLTLRIWFFCNLLCLNQKVLDNLIDINFLAKFDLLISIKFIFALAILDLNQ